MVSIRQICFEWLVLTIYLITTSIASGESLVAVPTASSRITRESATTPVHPNTIQRLIRILDNRSTSVEARGLKRVFISNRSVTCNDGSRSGFYLRKFHRSKKWIIFLEGGWYCYDHKSCRNRWIKLRHLMTSSQWPEIREIGGILSPNSEENPYWWNSNHVFIPYCTSDAWSGTREDRQDKFNFMGAKVLEQTIRDLLRLGLENATQLLLGGSSAGGIGAMVNLDSIRELLHDELGLRHIEVRGVIDSGWFLDRAPYAPGLPAVDEIRKGIKLWNGKMPKKCSSVYVKEPWRCYFGYRLYATLKSPLFVFQWLFDEAQMSADNVGAPVTKQQWDYIHKMGDSLRHSFQNVTALFAPSCISHSLLTKRDWLMVKVDETSIADALKCWEDSLDRKETKNIGIQNDEPPYSNNYQQRMTAMVRPVHMDGKVKLEKHHKNGAGRKQGRKKHKNRNRNKNRPNKRRKGRKPQGRRGENYQKLNRMSSNDNRAERSLLKSSNRRARDHTQCKMRMMERCSWPQCNHSCPKLHNPFTGEELDFIELLKSFGLDMDSVAVALGIDIHTLNNMDHAELLNLLTQSAS